MHNSDDRTGPDYVKVEYSRSELTGRIIAAAKAVHLEIGPGFPELVYQRALAIELAAGGLSFTREYEMEINYRGQKVGEKRVDFFVEGIMVEIKARSVLEDIHCVQALSYLKASGAEIGLLLNFGAKKLEIKRLIHTPKPR